MKRFIQLVGWISDQVQRVLLLLSALLLIAMVVIAGLGVIYRFILKNSLSWNEELDAYLFVWLTCVGAAIGYKYRAHPSVVFLVDRLPAKLKKVVNALADVIVAVLGIIMLIYGWQMVISMGAETASSINLSMQYPYLAIPVGGFALIIHAIAHIVSGLTAKVQVQGEEVYSHAGGKERTLWEH